MPLDITELPDEAKKALAHFPEFEPDEFNDSGANGYVLVGRHKVLNKKVAIKIYFHEKNEVNQEPSLISKINHQNVLKVFDARKVENECSYFLMPAADEGDLNNYLLYYHISTHLAHTLLCQLLSGIAALHASPNNMVHRDLKPENLLVNDDKIVIADFGSVRKVSDVTGKASASKHSILFRPPEAFGSGAFFDYKSDVYQAGLIGYLLFGGRLSNNLLEHLNIREIKKFKGIEVDGDDYEISCYIDSCIQNKVEKCKLADWGSMPFYIPRQLSLILKRAVCDYPNRYKNPSEFLSELMRIRQNLPDWLKDEDGYKLQSWNGNDYLICKEKSKIQLKKKKSNSKTYRRVSKIFGETYREVYSKLKKHVSLP